ncbi:MAG: DUF805 domain-containing protein [Flavobacteriaceae bacterium]|nr:DUF805 domain-containing protein [Flavobacteriaceae bacterium]|tara:strand:- start:936 stop:1328 length:393 start_codon:yes stop_codon:yes gene_type:complete
MIKHYLNVIQNNYANFSGRARRSEYWYFTLFYTIMLFLAMFLDSLLGTTFNMEMMGQSVDLGYGWIYVAVGILHFVPSLAVCVRRLHDVGKSGWFYLIILIPIIGFFWILFLFCKNGNEGDNNYGADPKA